MRDAVDLIEVWRGGFIEAVHRGHAVICDASGAVVESWGDPSAVVYPRSSAKMLQALPLVESGAAAAAGLGPEQLALACASHRAAAIHTERVGAWIAGLGLRDEDFRCGPQPPGDIAARDALIRAGAAPCQIHNNCSGKHAGFLTLNRHLGGGAEYHEVDHPVQQAARIAIEEMAEETVAGWGIDGCSAPNFALSMQGMAAAMARFAACVGGAGARAEAATRLAQAMMAHPELVSGVGEPCTRLMQACGGQAAIKGGAEGYYVAILPGRGLGIAVKATDGAWRASAAILTALLVRLGVLDAQDPVALSVGRTPITNWRGTVTGHLAPTDTLL